MAEIDALERGAEGGRGLLEHGRCMLRRPRSGAEEGRVGQHARREGDRKGHAAGAAVSYQALAAATILADEGRLSSSLEFRSSPVLRSSRANSNLVVKVESSFSSNRHVSMFCSTACARARSPAFTVVDTARPQTPAAKR